MNEVLVVFYGNFSETALSFVVGGSKLTFFVRQILNSRIAFILQREFSLAVVSIVVPRSTLHYLEPWKIPL